MAEAVRQRQQESVVRKVVVFQRAAHLKIESPADQDQRDVVDRVRIALA